MKMKRPREPKHGALSRSSRTQSESISPVYVYAHVPKSGKFFPSR